MAPGIDQLAVSDHTDGDPWRLEPLHGMGCQGIDLVRGQVIGAGSYRKQHGQYDQNQRALVSIVRSVHDPSSFTGTTVKTTFL
jgi:hypothetical protein